MKKTFPRLSGLCAVMLALALPGCQREERTFRELPSATVRTGLPRQSTLRPGPPASVGPGPAVRAPYDENAYGITQGQRLYQQFNCVGCHFHGGGGIGPPLMDEQWIYGSDPENLFATIVEGRPNGMPSFAGKIPDHQVWMIVSYVRSMGRLTPKAPAPARSDHMYSGESPQASEQGKVKGQAAEHLP